MTTPTCDPDFDADGYPTEKTLDRLRTWPVADAGAALDFLEAAWHWPDWISHAISAHEAGVLRAEPGERYLRAGTGGWSGNESLIGALFTNRIVWDRTWRLSTVGGLHIFRYPTA